MKARIFALGLATASIVACDTNELAYGDANSIIVAATPEVWSQVEDSLYAILETSIQTTVRNEEIFKITYQNPADSVWVGLRKFKQILALGSENDHWVRDALEAAGPEAAMEGYTEVADVWARGQSVTAIVLNDPSNVSPAVQALPKLRDQYVEKYRLWALNRMFVSGANEALADTLLMEGGFSLTLPNVYDWGKESDLFVFRNDNPDPSELIRQFTVGWTTLTEEDPSDEVLIAWRDQLASEMYDPRQLSDTELMTTRDVEIDGKTGRRLQAVWVNPPEADWPAAGVFMVQSVRCPEQNRLYLMDAWLYAPGRDKYEYLLQLETVLNTFRCPSSAAP